MLFTAFAWVSLPNIYSWKDYRQENCNLETLTKGLDRFCYLEFLNNGVIYLCESSKNFEVLPKKKLMMIEWWSFSKHVTFHIL